MGQKQRHSLPFHLIFIWRVKMASTGDLAHMGRLTQSGIQKNSKHHVTSAMWQNSINPTEIRKDKKSAFFSWHSHSKKRCMASFDFGSCKKFCRQLCIWAKLTKGKFTNLKSESLALLSTSHKNIYNTVAVKGSWHTLSKLKANRIPAVAKNISMQQCYENIWKGCTLQWASQFSKLEWLLMSRQHTVKVTPC